MTEPAEPNRSILANRAVTGVGLASFFSDSGHEMATAVLPAFLRSLGAPAVALGVIEGCADAALSVSKLAGGVVADREGVDNRRFAAAAYLTTGVAYGSFGLAGSWPFVALARSAAWAARGARSPVRDSILAGAVEGPMLGRAFGVERAGDSLGAIVGPLVAAALIGVVGFRLLFLISFLPALGAALAILLTTGRGRVLRRPTLDRAASSARQMLASPGPYRRLVAGVGLYGLGKFSATLLILRATILLHSSGRPEVSSTAIAVLLYTVHNAATAAAAYPAGAVADRVGRRAILVAGMVLFAGASIVFAFGSSNVAVLGILFAAVGTSTGMVETAQGAYASQIVPDRLRGRGFGLLGLVEGAGDLVSSVVVGVLWTVTAPAWGFVYAGTFAAAGALALLA